MYRHWPSSVQELLRATFPGVIRQIRRNFFNLVSQIACELIIVQAQLYAGMFIAWLPPFFRTAADLFFVNLFILIPICELSDVYDAGIDQIIIVNNVH